jgi:hypothetical protein
MSDDQFVAILLELEKDNPELTRRRTLLLASTYKDGLRIDDAARFYRGLTKGFLDEDPEPIEDLVFLLQISTLIATGRRGSDDQPYALIQPAAWYRLNIIGNGEDGVARDAYGTVYFDVLIHPTIAAAKRTLAPTDEVRVSPYDAVADRIPHRDMTESEFRDAFKRGCAKVEGLRAPSRRECESQWRRLAPEGGRKRGPKRSRQ